MRYILNNYKISHKLFLYNTFIKFHNKRFDTKNLIQSSQILLSAAISSSIKVINSFLSIPDSLSIVNNRLNFLS